MAQTMSNLKTIPYRDKKLLDFARGKPCLLTAVNGCLGGYNTSTTVACHSNQSKHGKGLGRKADDCYTVWGCVNCHSWLDQGKAPKAEKVRAFDAALGRQVREWEDFVATGSGMGWELIAVKKALERLKND